MVPRRIFLALAAAYALAVAAPAGAAWFPADTIDGPSPDIVALGGVDLSPDGGGAVVWLKNDGGVPHVFLARMENGSWLPPQRVDAGINEAASQPVVATSNGDQVTVAWISAGRLYAAAAPPGGNQPVGAPQFLAAGNARDPSVDIGVNETSYVAYVTDGGGGADVQAIRLKDGVWQGVIGPLDIAGAQPAGDGSGRPRVAVSADGNAVVVWGETGGDGRRHVYARRLTGLAMSSFPQEVSVGDLGGAPGGNADSPDIAIEEDGSFAWVVWRQDIGGVSRSLARRLVGSLFDPPVTIDSGSDSSQPRVSVNGTGATIAATQQAAGAAVVGSWTVQDIFQPPARWDVIGSASSPVVASGDNGEQSVAWMQGDGSVVARHRLEDLPLNDLATLSVPAFGPVQAGGGIESAADRLGDTVVGFVQQGADGRRLMVGVYDRPPGGGFGMTSAHTRNDATPTLRWHPGTDLWGGVNYTVVVDKRNVGTSDSDTFTLTQKLRDGKHTWQAIGFDRRGQATPTKLRAIRIDATPPRVRVSVRGRRSVGGVLRVVVRASDRSGVKQRWIDFGDHSPIVYARTATHRYLRSGRYTLTVRVTDKVHNLRRVRIGLRIRR